MSNKNRESNVAFTLSKDSLSKFSGYLNDQKDSSKNYDFLLESV